MFFDTHCHLNLSDFDNDRAMVIGNAKKAGVKKFIVPGVNLASSKSALELALQHKNVIYASIGFHPYEAQKNVDIGDLKKLIHLSLITYRLSPIAIGECGLDYHMYKGEKAVGKKDKQKKLFFEQLLLAAEFKLPVIIHCRDAFDDIFTVIDSLPSLPKAVFHCFSGGLQELRLIQEKKIFVGVNGNVTYSKQMEHTVPHVPLSMLLLETDAPYLSPLPHRGTRNEPKYIPLIAKKIAALQKTDIKNIEIQTTANASTLFQLA